MSCNKLMTYIYRAQSSGEKVELYFVDPDIQEETIYIALINDVGDDCIEFDSFDEEHNFVATIVKLREQLRMVVLKSVELEREKLNKMIKED